MNALRRFRQQVRSLGKGVLSTADAAAAAKRALMQSIAQGRSADGARWRPTQAGKRPLRNAAQAIAVEVGRGLIRLTVRGHHALHHLGRAKGGVRRPILPTEGLPPSMAAALREAALDAFKRSLS